MMSREEFPLAWLRDVWIPEGKWGMREGWGLNWAWLPRIREGCLATLCRIQAGDAPYAELYATHLAHLGFLYLKSGRRWSDATTGAAAAASHTSSPTSSRGMEPAEAILFLMRHGAVPLQPTEQLPTGPIEMRQCGSCLVFHPPGGVRIVKLSKMQSAVLCVSCT